VQSSSVPITRDRLGVQRNLCAELLRDTGEEESRNPEHITHYEILVVSDEMGQNGGTSDILSMPRQGPTWYSHWAGITSALVPEILIPASG
jgi:hypothetical protein